MLVSNAFVNAEKTLRESFAIRLKDSPNSWLTFNTQSMLGEALLGQKKYTEAESPLLSGYEGIIARDAFIPDRLKFRRTKAVQRLVRLYESWNVDEPDNGFATKASAWRTKLDSHNVQ